MTEPMEPMVPADAVEVKARVTNDGFAFVKYELADGREEVLLHMPVGEGEHVTRRLVEIVAELGRRISRSANRVGCGELRGSWVKIILESSSTPHVIRDVRRAYTKAGQRCYELPERDGDGNPIIAAYPLGSVWLELRPHLPHEGMEERDGQ